MLGHLALNNLLSYLQASFLGHSAPGAGSKVQRGGSGEHTNGCRSFIFGSRDDSNSEAQQPAEVPRSYALKRAY